MQRLDDEEGVGPARLLAVTSWQLTQTATRVARRIAAVFAAEGAHQYHYAMLSALEAYGPCSQADLGRTVGLDRKDVATRVTELVDAGWVTREAAPSDPRRNTIDLTRAGLARLHALASAVSAAQADIFSALSEAERVQLHEMLSRVRSDLSTRRDI